MNKKRFMQTLFAACTVALLAAGCTNDVMTAPDGGKDGGNADGETAVTFSLGLPQGDEVNYTRALVADDATEWAVKTLKAYHFKSTGAPTSGDGSYALVSAYNVPVYDAAPTDGIAIGRCIKSADAKYSLKLSLRDAGTSEDRHAFAFVVNDSCSAFDLRVEEALTQAQKATITLADLKKCTADKVVENNAATPELFFGNPQGLCMTGIKDNVELAYGADNAIGNIELTRVMARLDVKNFVPTSANFKILSVKVTGAAFAPLSAALFAEGKSNDLWKSDQTIKLDQASVYTEKGYQLPDAAGYLDASWVEDMRSNGRAGTWYKKVLYMYERPQAINSVDLKPLQAEVSYTLNGSPATVTVDLKNASTNTLEIKRNTVYTLQVGQTEAEGGSLIFEFKDTPWNLHEMDVDLK